MKKVHFQRRGTGDYCELRGLEGVGVSVVATIGGDNHEAKSLTLKKINTNGHITDSSHTDKPLSFDELERAISSFSGLYVKLAPYVETYMIARHPYTLQRYPGDVEIVNGQLVTNCTVVEVLARTGISLAEYFAYIKPSGDLLAVLSNPPVTIQLLPFRELCNMLHWANSQDERESLIKSVLTTVQQYAAQYVDRFLLPDSTQKRHWSKDLVSLRLCESLNLKVPDYMLEPIMAEIHSLVLEHPDVAECYNHLAEHLQPISTGLLYYAAMDGTSLQEFKTRWPNNTQYQLETWRARHKEQGGNSST